MSTTEQLGPLKDNATVAIIGGGPSGCSVALTLLRLGKELGKRFNIYVYEPKHFGVHYNQCLGVLSPPIQTILRDEFDIKILPHLVQREIAGYVLHGSNETILLEEHGGNALAVRRVEFDRYLLDTVARKGATVIRSRVTGLEIGANDVMIFSEGEHMKADMVFGCFGLNAGLAQNLRWQSDYKEPKIIETLVTRFLVDDYIMERFNNCVQSYLPNIENVEFAALIPKAEHVSVVVAGHKLRIERMKSFFELPEVRPFLPDNFEIDQIYKGQFPCSPAKGYIFDRFVTVGDAAGLIRPFKGKGINTAIISGNIAAKVAVKHGISKKAFGEYVRECSYLTKDYKFGQTARRFANTFSHTIGMDPIIDFANSNKGFKWALAMSVTGGATYREIIKKCLSPRIAFGILWNIISWKFKKGRWKGPDPSNHF